MSIFSVLRYPICMPPTLSQLEAVPVEVYNQWLYEVFSLEANRIPRSRLLGIMLRNPEAFNPKIERLQCIIYGLDE